MNTLILRFLILILLPTSALMMASSPGAAQGDSPPAFAAASIRFDDEVLSVLIDGNYAYVGLKTQLIVLDVMNPLAPRTLGAVNVPALASAKADDRLYTIAGLNFRILDVANPASPVLVSETQFSTLGTQYDLSVHGNYVYIGYFFGLAAIDVSNPYSPTLVGNLEYSLGQVRSVEVRKDPSGKSERVFAYLATMEGPAPGHIVLGGGLRIVDVTDPTDMQELYPCSNPIPCSSGIVSNDLALIGNDVYVLNDTRPWNEGSGLAIMDITDVTDVRQVGFHNLPDTALYHIAVAGGRSYMAVTNYVGIEAKQDLLTLDVTDKAMTRQVGLQALDYGVPYGAHYAHMATSGSCLYIVQGPMGLKILCDTTVTPTPPPLVWLPLLATPEG